MTPIRNTLQRKIVLDTVFELKNHPTADDVYAKVFENHPTISRGTVYRNLNMLASTGALLKVSMPDSADRYDHNSHDHHHVKCTCCNAFIDVSVTNMSQINSEIEEKTNYIIDDYSVVFKGICSKCR